MPALSTHLEGSLPHDLPQLGDVVVLLDGSPQVAIILGLGGGGLPPEGALREERAAQELRRGQPGMGTRCPGVPAGPCLTWVRAGLFQRSVISLRFSGRSSSCSACAASSMFLQKGSSHTGLALPGGGGRNSHQRAGKERRYPQPRGCTASSCPGQV